jgi:hypothetical protein
LSLYTLRSALGLARQIAQIVYLRLYAIRFCQVRTASGYTGVVR